MNRKRTFRGSLILLLVMIGCFLSGCGEIRVTHPLGNDILLEINDESCTLGTGILRLLEAKLEYQNAEDEVLWIRMIGSKTLEDYVKETVTDDLYRYTAAQAMADSLTLYINESERVQAGEDGRALLDRLDDVFDLDQYGITQADAMDLFIKRLYYEKVFDKLSESVSMEISESDTKAIEVNYVFVPLADGLNVAEQLRSEIKSGSDFEEVCAKYSYEANMHYTMTRGSMPAAFEQIAYALSDNECSEVVQTSEGYYIIYCLEDYKVNESAANRNSIISNRKREIFQTAYEEFALTAKLRFNDSVWDRYKISTMD